MAKWIICTTEANHKMYVEKIIDKKDAFYHYGFNKQLAKKFTKQEADEIIKLKPTLEKEKY